MKKTLLTSLVTAVFLGGFVALVLSVANAKKTNGPASNAASSSPSPAEKSATINYTDAGFDKPVVEVALGSSVTFINKRPSRPMWVASNEHPEHLLYPEFDQGMVLGYEPLPKDSKFNFTFNKKGSWIYHDHYDATQQGVIKVN